MTRSAKEHAGATRKKRNLTAVFVFSKKNARNSPLRCRPAGAWWKAHASWPCGGGPGERRTRRWRCAWYRGRTTAHHQMQTTCERANAHGRACCGWTRSRRLGKGREYLNPCRKEMSRAEWSSGVEVKVVRCSVAMVGEEESLVVSEGGRGAGASREQNDYQQLFRDSHLKNRIFVRDAIR